MRRSWPVGGTFAWALLFFVLLVVPAVPFFTEMQVFEDVDIDEMYLSSWYEFHVFVCDVWWVADEIGELK